MYQPTGLLSKIVLFALFAIASVSSHRCYICGAPNAHNSGIVFPGDSSIPSCDGFNPDDLDLFARECPPEYSGCITQTNGTQVTRSCEDLPVNDCKIVNNIEYCYCKDNLCNGEKAPPMIVHKESQTHPISDDEDINEGSGKSQEENYLDTTKPIPHKPFDDNNKHKDHDGNVNPTLTTTAKPTSTANSVTSVLGMLVITFINIL